MGRAIFHFGAFWLDPTGRTLTHGASPVRLGGRAMDLLLTLAANPGAIVGKRELLAAVWGDTNVGEANLKVTVAQLRDALRRFDPSSSYIHTVVGRGYWLSAKPQNVAAPTATGASLGARGQGNVLGRGPELSRLRQMVASERLVTIVGPGGIGKTTLARSFAEEFASTAVEAVTFVDLSRLEKPELVGAAVAAAFGVRSGQDFLASLSALLGDRRMLLVLDTCEHVASAVANLVEVVLARSGQVRVLATSRRLLGTRFEQAFWIDPLATPDRDEAADLGTLLAYAAPQLLIRRAEARGYALKAEDGPEVAAICRKLDGLPLALELAAPRLAARGASVLLRELDEQFLILDARQGNAPQRQRTMARTLRWSYDLLSPAEAKLLRALSVFASDFTAEGATHVAASILLRPIDVADGLAALRAKSMLAVDAESAEVRYRLLDSTRLFARDLLDEAGEAGSVRTGHAAFVLAELRRLVANEARWSRQLWRAACLAIVDDLRSAIRWTLDRSANPFSGILLVKESLPIFLELSFSDEVRANVTRARAELVRLGSGDPALELGLVVGLATVATYVGGDAGETVALFRTALDLARQIDDAMAECRVLGAFATYHLMQGQVSELPVLLDELARAAERTGQLAAHVEEQQIRVQYEIRASHFASAIERVRRLEDLARREASAATSRFQINQQINVGIQHAALSWLTGQPLAAIEIAERATGRAKQLGHGLTIIHALAQGIVWTRMQCGEYRAVLPDLGLLRRLIIEQGMASWIPVADTYSACVAAFLGERPAPALLRSAFYGVQAGVPQIQHDARFALLAQAMLANGQHDDAEKVLDHVFLRNRTPWAHSEFLRFRAAIELNQNRFANAVATLRMSLEVAEHSGSIAWILRSADDLAHAMAVAEGRKSDRHKIHTKANTISGKFSPATLTPVEKLAGDRALEMILAGTVSRKFRADGERFAADN